MLEPIGATILTAFISSIVGAVVGALVSKLKTIRMDDERSKKEAAEMKEMLRQNMLMTCRMTIYDEHFSTDEKLEAYIVYRDVCHGNHQTKTYMDNLVGCNVDDYIDKHGLRDKNGNA